MNKIFESGRLQVCIIIEGIFKLIKILFLPFQLSPFCRRLLRGGGGEPRAKGLRFQQLPEKNVLNNVLSSGPQRHNSEPGPDGEEDFSFLLNKALQVRIFLIMFFFLLRNKCNQKQERNLLQTDLVLLVGQSRHFVAISFSKPQKLDIFFSNSGPPFRPRPLQSGSDPSAK